MTIGGLDMKRLVFFVGIAALGCSQQQGGSTHAPTPLSMVTAEEHAAVDPAEKPHGSYVVIAPDPRKPRIGPGPLHRILYLNRHGVTVTPGSDDSSSNVSSIPSSVSTVSAWSYSDADWTTLMNCVKAQYAPFDIQVTDVDPGATQHIECVVGGTPQQVGMPSGVGGVSPVFGDGSVVGRAIVYTFSAVYGGDIQSICETAAQESGHALGMDHEMKCEDPMTYLTGCGSKTFQDVAVPCGEYSNRTCMCGNPTQNSVQHLLSVLGPAPTTGGTDNPPTCSITSPADGATVPMGFSVVAVASDDNGISKVELHIDGSLVDTKSAPPYTFVAPASLAAGQHSVQAVAFDSIGQQTPATITINVTGTPPGGCTTDPECGTGAHCAGGSCVPNTPPGGTPGGLGTPCGANSDCASNMCGSDGSTSVCTQSCDTSDPTSCPTGFGCTTGSSGGGCWPSDGTGNPGAPGLITGACNAAAGRGGALPGLGSVLLIGLVIVALRRRSS